MLEVSLMVTNPQVIWVRAGRMGEGAVAFFSYIPFILETGLWFFSDSSSYKKGKKDKYKFSFRTKWNGRINGTHKQCLLEGQCCETFEPIINNITAQSTNHIATYM